MNWHPEFRISGLLPQNWLEQNQFNYPYIAKVLNEWNSDKKEFVFNTSGSTGTPKKVFISRNVMIHSAKATGTFFQLEPKNMALLCLPVEFIGGFMMFVRAMILGLDLVVSHPQVNEIIKFKGEYHFMAMTPYQVSIILKICPSFFDKVNKVIIGGGEVGNELRNSLYQIDTDYYSTYGMTETCSHVALNNIEPNNWLFKALPGVSFGINRNKQLIIDAPNYEVGKLITNDLVDLKGINAFEWLGRLDNVINSGGVKVNPERIERLMHPQINANCFVSGLRHDQLGNEVVLFVEGKSKDLNLDFSELSKYEIPKRIIFIDSFKYTETNKIDRLGTINLL